MSVTTIPIIQNISMATIDVLSYISNYLELFDKIRFIQVCKYVHGYQQRIIKEIHSYIDDSLTSIINNTNNSKMINDNILKNYTYITELDASCCENIKDISFMTNLRILKANCGICQSNNCNIEDISHLDLIELHINYNRTIKNIGNMTNLQILNADRSGICNEDLTNLNLIELNINDTDITNISHMTRLKILHANSNQHLTCISTLSQLEVLSMNYKCSIKDVFSKNIKKLSLEDNPNHIDISHLTSLEYLNISGEECAIDAADIKNLKLTSLDISENNNIVDITYMTTLTSLDACYCNISSLKGLDLIKLIIEGNENITDISHLTNLKELNVAGCDNIGDNDLKNMDLIKLTVDDNENIQNIKHMTNLTYLSAAYCSAIGPEDIEGLNIETLYTLCNIKFKDYY